MLRKILFSLLAIIAYFTILPETRASSALEIVNKRGEQTTSITDGDLIQIHLLLEAPVQQESTAIFRIENTQLPLGCAIPAGAKECTSAAFNAYGWYWVDGMPPAPSGRLVTALVNDQLILDSATLTVKPRPVILVHGFISNYEAWQSYLGSQGFLAMVGIPGFAVGDGQVDGTLNTGSIDQPTQQTNTIAQNSVILASYIDRVKALTGAEYIDLIGHSMGGLISRYYIDRLMKERDVAQLIMLGTPSAGSDCAILPSTLGFYYPTVLEIRSSYMVGVFNQQIHKRLSVPFFALAGTKITSPVGSPCASTPNDMVVSVDSVSGINLTFKEIPILHVDMNASAQAFHDFVLPLLQRPPNDTWQVPDPPAKPPTGGTLQFTRVYSGHVDPGATVEQNIQLEPGLSVANFALYDPSRSLEVTVTGASGNVIQLTAADHGLITVDDPVTLVTMGYGFANPRPGPWKIELTATNRTPATGADFALTAQLSGGAELSASVEPFLPAINTPVSINASLALAGRPLTIQSAEAHIRSPDGTSQTIPLAIENNLGSASWQPDIPGFFALDLTVSALLEDGTEIERTAYLAIEAQADARVLPQQFTWSRGLVAVICGALLLFGLVIFILGYIWFKKLIKRENQ